ncbi:MAG: TolC family protein [Candidatus Obscuribacter sp.]|nr:TolC family protein [Candidatus Melainabacteria bacterium]MDX1985196.1 TolC family protein [Candidatus Obscuribacter sp.]
MQESPVSKARILSSLCLLTLALAPYQALRAQEASATAATAAGKDAPAESLDKVDAPSAQVPVNDALTGPSTGLSRDAAGAYTGSSAPDPSGLVPTKRKEDYEVINTQAESFRQRFLQGEAIELRLPLGGELMPLSATLPPIRLEASYTQPVSLKEAVLYCLDNNLDIRIQREAMTQNKWLSVGAFGKFLPDALMQYRSLYQAGTSLIGGAIPITFANPFVSVSAGYRFYGFRGGSVMFGSLASLHNFRASREQYKATINDTLLSITRAYYELVRNQALLQIQTRAVDVSKAQVSLNRQLEKAGTGTRFQVLQSETQLARDEQGLLTQEVGLRRAAINLATALNLNATVNLLSVESEVRKVRLVDPSLDINRLINIAILNRPELKQFEELRIAAKRNIQVQAAPLYPQFQFFGSYAGNGQTLGTSYTTTAPSYTAVPLAQNAAPQSILTNIQNTGLVTTASTVVPAGMVYNPGAVINRRVRESYQIGVQVDWNYLSLGVPDLANVQAARAQARQASLRVNKTIMDVYQQVRDSYLQSQTAERQIEVATKEVLSSAEELRLARVRLANGVGTNIDVINAQRDFTQALVRKADAIIQFNILQAQLLRDVGIISADTLTSGRLAK